MKDYLMCLLFISATMGYFLLSHLRLDIFLRSIQNLEHFQIHKLSFYEFTKFYFIYKKFFY